MMQDTLLIFSRNVILTAEHMNGNTPLDLYGNPILAYGFSSPKSDKIPQYIGELRLV